MSASYIAQEICTVWLFRDLSPASDPCNLPHSPVTKPSTLWLVLNGVAARVTARQVLRYILALPLTARTSRPSFKLSGLETKAQPPEDSHHLMCFLHGGKLLLEDVQLVPQGQTLRGHRVHILQGAEWDPSKAGREHSQQHPGYSPVATAMKKKG